jgi:hypothetical protein
MVRKKKRYKRLKESYNVNDSERASGVLKIPIPLSLLRQFLLKLNKLTDCARA